MRINLVKGWRILSSTKYVEEKLNIHHTEYIHFKDIFNGESIDIDLIS
jgi:hypothetical protein